MSHPNHYQEPFRDFRQKLEEFSQIADDGTHELPLKHWVNELQQIFQGRILSLNLDELKPELEQRVRSIQVEINKQLRLLGMDMMFLQAARQPETLQQRQNQILERVYMLKRYCEMVIEEGGEGE
jgi:hypothetical protein